MSTTIDLSMLSTDLTSVDNTADADKPVSTAQQTALDDLFVAVQSEAIALAIALG